MEALSNIRKGHTNLFKLMWYTTSLVIRLFLRDLFILSERNGGTTHRCRVNVNATKTTHRLKTLSLILTLIITVIHLYQG